MRTAAAGLILWLAGAGSAIADEAAAIDRFLNFAANGCVNARAGGASVSAFAMENHASPADESRARAILGTDKGDVYFRDDPVLPLAIADRADASCTVNGRNTGDTLALTEAALDFFGGPGGGFYIARVFEEAAGAAGWTRHYVFVGQRRGRKMTLLFSTTPGAESLDQVFFAAALSP